MNYTVVIPTRNRPELLQRALRSVYAQSCPPAQIVVVDDGSDETIELPEELRDERTSILRNENPQGGPISRNLGMARANHPILAFLDDDDEWLPHKMERQLKYLEENPDCLLVSCGYLRIQNGMTYPDVVTGQFLERYGSYDSYIGSFSFMVLRRKGGGTFLPLDPGMPAFQDWDYYLKLRQRGPIGMLPEALGLYHAHDEVRITTKGRNRLLGLRKCYFRHRRHLHADARRWVLSRMIFDRAACARDSWSRARLVALSVGTGFHCKLPKKTKIRALSKRVLNIAFGASLLERFRSVVFGIAARLRASRIGDLRRSLTQPI